MVLSYQRQEEEHGFFFLLSETIKGEGAVHNLRGRSTSGRSEIRTAPGYIYCRRGNGLAESADGSQSGHV
jgi:hypothetical protein